MKNSLNEVIWNQFGASLESLQNAIKLCPVDSWKSKKLFWHKAFHCIFFTDYYLTLEPSTFEPPLPFTRSEFENEIPPRDYSKEELLEYIAYCMVKAKNILGDSTLNIETIRWKNTSGSMDYSLLELMIYNMRHIQHHAAQLNLILRQDIQDSPDWVSRSSTSLSF